MFAFSYAIPFDEHTISYSFSSSTDSHRLWVTQLVTPGIASLPIVGETSAAVERSLLLSSHLLLRFHCVVGRHYHDVFGPHCERKNRHPVEPLAAMPTLAECPIGVILCTATGRSPKGSCITTREPITPPKPTATKGFGSAIVDKNLLDDDSCRGIEDNRVRFGLLQSQRNSSLYQTTQEQCRFLLRICGAAPPSQTPTTDAPQTLSATYPRLSQKAEITDGRETNE